MAENSPAMRFFELGMGPHDVLFSHMPARELVRLMLTCRRVHWLVYDTCFSLPRLLYPFFGDATEVDRFQAMQAESATVISGSIALQFFNRTTWPDSDLDLYTHRGTASIPVRFLLSNGYTFKRRKVQNPDVFVQLIASVEEKAPSYLGRGIADVLDFYKGNQKIQLIIATSTPMETIISFHSTPVMNVLTHDKGYALYPWSTFVTGEALIIETAGAGQQMGRQKYIDRGWEMINSPSLNQKSELGVRIGRWVGDAFTWTLPLWYGASATRTPDLCRLNSWRLDCDAHTTWTHWEVLQNAALKYEYIIEDTSTVSAIWDEVLSSPSPTVDAQLCHTVIRRRQTTSEHFLQHRIARSDFLLRSNAFIATLHA
ncbi:hypothetical protein FB451DRAFT_593931 [Mycena latifolia]|nr:hypothetical protein FB451DRAFT_593931 [Mycena latifolia]